MEVMLCEAGPQNGDSFHVVLSFEDTHSEKANHHAVRKLKTAHAERNRDCPPSHKPASPTGHKSK